MPGASEALIADTTAFVGQVRGLDLDKSPGMAETIDWVSALVALGVHDLMRADVIRTLGAVVKTPDDRHTVLEALDDLHGDAASA